MLTVNHLSLSSCRTYFLPSHFFAASSFSCIAGDHFGAVVFDGPTGRRRKLPIHFFFGRHFNVLFKKVLSFLKICDTTLVPPAHDVFRYLPLEVVELEVHDHVPVFKSAGLVVIAPYLVIV